MERALIMKITLRQRYSTYRPGDVVDCDDEVARALVAAGVATGEEECQLIETAAIDPTAETADMTPRQAAPPAKAKR